MKTPLRVLIVEDSESDAELILLQLKKADYLVHYEQVETAEDMKAALEKQAWDIVISDYKMPRFDAPAALKLFKKSKLDIPFIVVSGTVGEEIIVELMKSGAHDYLMKNKLTRLAPVVKRELAEAQMRRQHKKVEEESVLLAQAVKSTRDCISITDMDNNILFVNDSFIAAYGYSEAELIGKNISIVRSPIVTTGESKAIQSGTIKQGWHGEIVNRRKNGSEFTIELWTSVVTNKSGNPIAMVGVARDITEHKQAEEALAKEQFLLNMLMDNVPDHIYFKDKDSRFIRINKDHAKKFGLSNSAQAIGKTDFDFFTKEHAQHAFEDEQTIIRTGKPIVGIEEKETWPDGRVTWVSTTKMPLRDKEGNIIGTFGVSRDITEHKKAEIKLKESEERYRRITEFSPDAIAVHSEGKIEYVNPAAITLLGANSASELIGKPFFDFIHPDYRDSINQQIIAVMKEDYAIPLTEQKFLRLDGSVVEVEVAALPIVYKEKKAMQIVVRDISENKKLQNQYLQSQKIQSIGTLAGGIAHDFNNILGIILAYSSLLEKNKLTPEKFAVSINAINQAVQRGAALVRQILTFARRTDITYEAMDISELIHELLSMLEQTFPKTITFSENIASSLPLIIADRTQVHQALLNLCINARDAMPHGGSISITAELKIKEQIAQQFPTANEETYLCLAVADTGKGMDEATCLQVFDPFFTTKEKGKGTGLGLSVVYGVVQAHHGFIDLKSKPNIGTTFRLFIPVPAINKQSADFQQSVEPFEIGGTETILFVEDEELLINMVSLLLESKGYRVICARDGLEAVNIYQSKKQKIELVITDMGLPVMTGTDEFKKIKEFDPNVKVIFASGYFEPDVKSELLKDGAKGFIQKPYEPSDVLRIIRNVLDQKV